MGLLHARAEDVCEVEDGDEKEDGDRGSDSASLTVCAEVHKIKRHKTTMRREILQLCRVAGCFLFPFFALEFLSSGGKKQQQIS